MADKRISELTTLTGANSADDDLLVIVDSSASETKSITLGELEKALGERDFSFADDDKLVFGDGDDLQIYHDGSNSYIDDSGTGDLYVRASDDLRLQVRNDTDTAWASSVICNDGGETSLHYNGTKKIATTNTGIDVTGTVTADGLDLDGVITADATDATVTLTGTASASVILQDTGAATNQQVTQLLNNGGDFVIRSLNDTKTGLVSTIMTMENLTGNVGIGTSSPSSPLTVDTGAGTFEVKAKGSGSVTLASDASLTYFGSTHEFYNTDGTTQYAVIDQNGNLLVGTTDTFPAGAGETDAGVAINANGRLITNVAGDAHYFSRTGSDGDIIQFRKDGAPVGSISTNSGRLELNAAGSQGRLAVAGTDYYTWTSSGFGVVADNARDLGSASYRFKDLYLSGSSITGGGVWPTATVSRTQGRAAISSDSGDGVLIITNHGSGTLAGRGGQIFLGARGTDGTNNMSLARIKGFRDNSTSGNLATQLVLSTSDSSGTEVEGIRIDASGNVLVNCTSANTQGTAVSGSNPILQVEGDIVPSIWAGLTGHSDLGDSTYNYEDAYVRDGVTTTSDRNEKQDIEELSEAEQRVAVAVKSLLRKYRWISSVAEKGDDARIHFGIIAQDLQAAFEAEGLDAGRYAMFMSNTWWEAEETYTNDEGVEQTRINTYKTAEEAPEGATERTRLGVRYSELLAFIIAAI